MSVDRDATRPDPLPGRLDGGPVRFRERLQRMGPTYVKIGQYLGLRPDAIPDEYARELLRLVDDVEPVPWDQVRAVLAEDLGDDPDRLFARINPRPVAARSLAQTHVAELGDGREVTLKIQRPGVHARVLRDLSHSRPWVRALRLGRVPLAVEARDLLDELRDWLLQELDLRRELANMTRLRRLAAGGDVQVIPKPYPELSGDRVLTADYVRGIPFSELLLARRADNAGLDLGVLAENMILATLTQIFRYRFFHADLHPGNLIAVAGERVGFVDFGLCYELDETIRERQARDLAALYGRDVDRMYQAITEVLVPSDETDLAVFRREFSAETRSWLGEIGSRGAGHGRSAIAEWIVGVMRIASRHHLALPPRVLSMYRTLLASETVAHELGEDADLGSVGGEFFRDLHVEESVDRLSSTDAQSLVLDLLSLARDSPGQIHQILSDFANGRFSIAVTVEEASRTARERSRRARLVATAIASVAVAAALAVPARGSVAAVALTLLLVVLWAAVVVQWRRLR